jgi:hypothetical protein
MEATVMVSTGKIEPSIGARILTSDGQELGKVKEVKGNAFKVDVHLDTDYWLPIDCIEKSSADLITLAYNKEELALYQWSYAD